VGRLRPGGSAAASHKILTQNHKQSTELSSQSRRTRAKLGGGPGSLLYYFICLSLLAKHCSRRSLCAHAVPAPGLDDLMSASEKREPLMVSLQTGRNCLSPPLMMVCTRTRHRPPPLATARKCWVGRAPHTITPHLPCTYSPSFSSSEGV
jgi:hypothetical protein